MRGKLYGFEAGGRGVREKLDGEPVERAQSQVPSSLRFRLRNGTLRMMITK